MLGKFQSPHFASPPGDQSNWQGPTTAAQPPSIPVWPVGVLWLLTPHIQASHPQLALSPLLPHALASTSPTGPLPSCPALSVHGSTPLRPDPFWCELALGWGPGIEPSRSAPLGLEQLHACWPLPQTLLEAKCLSAALPPLGTHVKGMEFPWLPPLKECARMPNLLVINAVTVP